MNCDITAGYDGPTEKLGQGAAIIAGPRWKQPSFSAAVVCSVVLTFISGWLRRSTLLKCLGQKSFFDNLLHVMFIAGTRIAIARIFGEGCQVTGPAVVRARLTERQAGGIGLL
jgi:hypothetical protein